MAFAGFRSSSMASAALPWVGTGCFWLAECVTTLGGAEKKSSGRAGRAGAKMGLTGGTSGDAGYSGQGGIQVED